MTTPAAASSSPRSSSAVLALLAAFVLGMIAGGAVLHIARAALPHPPGPRPPGPPPIRRLEHDLGLDREQMEKLERIVGESRERMHGEMEATRRRIREILTPQQRVRFDAMKPPPPPGFPPPRGGAEGPPPGPEGPPPDPEERPPGEEPR